MEEAKVGAQRAETMGPSGWVRPRETINKRFLHSTIRNVVLSNRHQQRSRENCFPKHAPKEKVGKSLDQVEKKKQGKIN